MNSIRIETVNPSAAELLAITALGPGGLVVVESSATGGGVGFTEIGTVPLVSGTDEYTFIDPVGVPGTVYRVTYDSAARDVLPDYSAEFQVSSTDVTVTLAQVRALISSGLSDDELMDVVIRAEALLAAQIGPLTGERTDVFTITTGETRRSLRLRRVTAAATILNDGTDTPDFRIAGDGRTVTPLSAEGWARGYWTGVVEITYTPNDGQLVASAVIDIVRTFLTESTFQSESIGDYSYTRGVRVSVAAIARRYGLLGPALPTAVKLPRGTYPGWVGTARPA